MESRGVFDPFESKYEHEDMKFQRREVNKMNKLDELMAAHTDYAEEISIELWDLINCHMEPTNPDRKLECIYSVQTILNNLDEMCNICVEIMGESGK